MGTVLAKGIESYLRDETTGTAETAFVWVRLPRRYAFLGTLLGPGDADVDDGEKPP